MNESEAEVTRDPVAASDQACEAAKHTARPIAAFCKQLIDGGMEHDAARAVTLLYARRILLSR